MPEPLLVTPGAPGGLRRPAGLFALAAPPQPQAGSTANAKSNYL
jgi:hypothetical protein